MTSLILRTVARVSLHLTLLFSVFLLVSGHNAPGGGFIAGLVAAAALVLQALAFGVEHARRMVPVDETALAALGLLLAAGTGVAALVLGQPFLTSGLLHLDLPFWPEVKISSAFFFDLGVYLVVVGMVLQVIFGLREA